MASRLDAEKIGRQIVVIHFVLFRTHSCLAEKIFTTLGWKDVRHIDFVARSKATPLDMKAVKYLHKEPREMPDGLTEEEKKQWKEIFPWVITGRQMMDALYGAMFFRY